jgi:dihydroflavonol-4-reductase
MKILVTGSTGFIGSQLVRRLAGLGHDVRAFHRPTSTLRMLEGLPVEHAVGDLTQSDSIQAALEGIEVVFHVAAMLGGRDEPGRMYAVTVEGTRAVLKAARTAGVRRFIHTSSVAALGVPARSQVSGGIVPFINEKHTWNYRPEYWPYGYAKYLAELEVQRATAQGLDTVIVNPSLVFGPGDVYRQNNSLIMQIARQKLPVVVQGGVNAVHIDDVIDGHLAALERGHCGERYILGGENLSILQLVQLIGKVVGKPAPKVMVPVWLVKTLARPIQMLDAFLPIPVETSILRLAGRYFYYDLQKSQSELGLNAPRPTAQAIAEAYQWFQEVGAAEN